MAYKRTLFEHITFRTHENRCDVISFKGSGQDACDVEAFLTHIGMSGEVFYFHPNFEIHLKNETDKKLFGTYLKAERLEYADRYYYN